MWDFLEEVARNAAYYEAFTWAGIVYLTGLALVLDLRPAVSIAEKAMLQFSLLLEGSRKYRAAKRGFSYEPVIRPTRLKPERHSRLKNVSTVVGYLILSPAVVAVVYRLP